MNYKEVKGDLFTAPEAYYLAQCISSDCALAAGIATQFQKKFNLRDKLLKYDKMPWDKVREMINKLMRR